MILPKIWTSFFFRNNYQEFPPRITSKVSRNIYRRFALTFECILRFLLEFLRGFLEYYLEYLKICTYFFLQKFP